MLFKFLHVVPILLLAMISSAAGGDVGADRSFLDQHWRRPIPPQGPPPRRFSPIEKSLAPASCGTCHPAQLSDWRTTLHARSMGPGVTGQLVAMWREDPESARLCLSCHAPLAEQHPQTDAGKPNPAFDTELARSGLACAVCHVRRHERFGPPRRDAAPAPAVPRRSLPHNGVARTAAFERSEFCASCHQFEADGLALNGKLLENTYEEWKRSPAAREGRQCQDCHMPERRHLWRGIHDLERVKSGIEVIVTTDRQSYRAGDALTAVIRVKSVRIGHFFPTYVTPKVVVRAGLVDATGHIVADTEQEYIIGREVTPDLSRELFDTRIPSGEQVQFLYRRRLAGQGLILRVTMTVHPDHFYTGFFKSLMASGSGIDSRKIHAALEATRGSAFEIFTKDLPLT